VEGQMIFEQKLEEALGWGEQILTTPKMQVWEALWMPYDIKEEHMNISNI